MNKQEEPAANAALKGSFDDGLHQKIEEIVQSQQGRKKLSVQGYMYNWCNNARFWRCDMRTAINYKATVKTDLNNNIVEGNHHHK